MHPLDLFDPTPPPQPVRPNLVTTFRGLSLDWRVTEMPWIRGQVAIDDVELLTPTTLTKDEIEIAADLAVREWEKLQ